MTHRCNNKPIDTANLTVPVFGVERRQLNTCFDEGMTAAVNHYYGESTEDLPYGIKGWNTYPYQVTRPEAHYSWMAGFHFKWGELVREFGKVEVGDEE